MLRVASQSLRSQDRRDRRPLVRASMPCERDGKKSGEEDGADVEGQGLGTTGSAGRTGGMQGMTKFRDVPECLRSKSARLCGRQRSHPGMKQLR